MSAIHFRPVLSTVCATAFFFSPLFISVYKISIDCFCFRLQYKSYEFIRCSTALFAGCMFEFSSECPVLSSESPVLSTVSATPFFLSPLFTAVYKISIDSFYFRLNISHMNLSDVLLPYLLVVCSSTCN